MNLIAVYHTLSARVRMNLDDSSTRRTVDRSDVLSVMDKTPERLSPPSNAATSIGRNLEKPTNVVFGGVGGSGIIGDVVMDYLRNISGLPLEVCRSIELPSYVGKETLFVAISYSGETPETLSLLDQAVNKGANVVAIASGGRLVEQASKAKFPYLKVPGGMLPRLALPELLAATIFVMGAAGVIDDAEGLLLSAQNKLRSQVLEIGSNSTLERNPAKKMAESLLGKLPLLFGNEDGRSVLRRFKNELNENSKMPAFYYTLPEAYHDDVEGLKTLGELSKPQPIMLRDHETDGQRRTRLRLYGLFKELRYPPALEFEGSGTGRFERLVTAVTFGDYVSVYLALLREVDPSQLTLIPGFREAMRGA